MSIQNIKNRYDIFAYPVYGFNFEGKEKIGSWFGLFWTFIGFLMVMSFSSIKMIHLVEGKNPLITTSERHG
jgi:hypothetical protein